MKQYLRNRVAVASSYLEIAVSVVILLGIVLVSISLVISVFGMFTGMFANKGEFSFEVFLGHALKIIIGIEFVKMIAKHTPESVIEVLLFAIARKLIVGSPTSLDIAIEVLSIAILFALRKYLLPSKWAAPEGIVLSGATPVREANRIAGVAIPEEMGATLSGVVANHLKQTGQKILEDSSIEIGGVRLRIYSQNDGVIEKVEIISAK